MTMSSMAMRKTIAVHRITEPRPVQARFAEVGQCIYCASRDYGSLTDEHIIPDGLGGDLILPKSSCTRCARPIHQFETGLMKSTLHDVRGSFGIRSRKRRKHRDNQQALFDRMGHETKSPFGSESPWAMIQSVTGQRPGIMLGHAEDFESQVYMQAIWPRDNQTRLEKIGASSLAEQKLHKDWWFKSAAKIAHAFAAAKLGLDAFKPILPDWFTGRSQRSLTYAVGTSGPQDEVDCIHFVELYTDVIWQGQPNVPRGYYFADVRFFANVLSHTYTVVIGPIATAKASL